MARFAARKGKKDSKSKNEEPGMSQFGLIESISTSDSIIAITEEGRMLLVRARDGYIHVPSMEAVTAKRLLSTDAVEDESSYMPLDKAISWPDILSHDDITSLGAATYSSY